MPDINDIHRFYEANLPSYKRKHIIECNKFFLSQMEVFWKKPINDVLNRFNDFKKFVVFDWLGEKEIRTKKMTYVGIPLEPLPRHEKCTCGGHLVERRNRSDGSKFLGCSRYPKCKNTAPVL